jgi:ketosteroid isomerase-like protein
MASGPLETVRALDAAFSRGDVDGILGFYEDGAAMVVQPGTTAEGKVALRRAFEGILASFREPPSIKQLKTHVIEAGDIALFTFRWSISGTSVDGSIVSRIGDASSIFRRRGDGSWKLVIDNAWGPAVLG